MVFVRVFVEVSVRHPYSLFELEERNSSNLHVSNFLVSAHPCLRSTQSTRYAGKYYLFCSLGVSAFIVPLFQLDFNQKTSLLLPENERMFFLFGLIGKFTSLVKGGK